MLSKTIEHFGRTTNYYIKHKPSLRNNLILEDGIIISDNKEVAEKLNKFVIDSVENIDIKPFLTRDKITGD